MFDNLRQDLRRSYYRKVGLWRIPLRFMTTRGFRAVMLYRTARWCHLCGIPFIPKLLTVINENWNTTAIHYQADIGPGLTLPHALGIVIGPGVKIGRNAQIFQGAGIGAFAYKSPTIGEDFVAFANAQVIGGVTIGDRVRVGVNCSVIFDVPSDTSIAQGKQTFFKNASEATNG